MNWQPIQEYAQNVRFLNKLIKDLVIPLPIIKTIDLLSISPLTALWLTFYLLFILKFSLYTIWLAVSFIAKGQFGASKGDVALLLCAKKSLLYGKHGQIPQNNFPTAYSLQSLLKEKSENRQ